MTEAMNYTFNYRSGSNNTGRSQQPSKPMITLYFKMCKERNATPKNIEGLTRDELQALLDELKAFQPPTQPQLDRIYSTWTTLYEANHPKVKQPSPPKGYMEKLNKDIASGFIEKMNEMVNEVSHNIPPTNDQIKIMIEWFLCPDIPFEEYDIKKRIPYVEEKEIQVEDGAEGTRTSGAWIYKSMRTRTETVQVPSDATRLLDPMEFAEEIRTKLSRNEASTFISKYQSVAWNWKRTRVSPGQMNHIRTLEGRLGNTQAPPSPFFNEEGEADKYYTYSDSKEEMNQQPAYTPLDEVQLLQFSYEEAKEYINMLNFEIRNTDLYKFGNIYDDTQDALEQSRQAKSKNDAKVEALTELSGILYRLQSIDNMQRQFEMFEEDALHALFDYKNAEGETIGASMEKRTEIMTEIREYMMSLVDNDKITFLSLASMCEDSEIAQQCLTGRF